MAITYSAADNKITVTGYSSGMPCTFNDIYNADVAGGWGVVSRQGGTQFYITCHLYISTGYFKDTAKDVKIDAAASTYIRLGSTAHLQLGNKDANGNVSDGCKVDISHSDGFIFGDGGIGVKLYDCYFDVHGATRISLISNGLHEIIGCVFDNTNIIRIYGADSIVRNLWMHRGTQYGFNPGSIAVVENVRVYARPFGIYVNGITNATFVGVVTKDITNKDLSLLNYSGTMTVIDCELANWSIAYSNSPNGLIIRRNTFNLKVVDENGDNINDAIVKIWDKDNNLVVDTTTTAGVIPEQTITRGTYTQATAAVLQDKSPHTLQISKAGTDYLTYEKKFTLDKKIDWRIAMINVADIVSGITDIKGTGFVKDTDSLVDIRPETDKIQTGIIDVPNIYKADVSDLTDILAIVKRAVGLIHENYRLFSLVYDGNNLLTSATIKIYPSASDCDNDTNVLAEYLLTAIYTDLNLTSYKVTKV